jgi:hypothetical protein
VFHSYINASNNTNGVQSLRSWNCRRIAAILKYNTIKVESLLTLDDNDLLDKLHVTDDVLDALYRLLDKLRSQIFPIAALKKKFISVEIPRISWAQREAIFGIDETAIKSGVIKPRDYDNIVRHIASKADVTEIYSLCAHIPMHKIDRLLDRLLLHPMFVHMSHVTCHNFLY